jgi:hypothetical protein
VNQPVPETVRGAPAGRRTELLVVGMFVLVQVAAPFVVGEVYPFTISPMFSDRPERYAVYRVTDQQGNELDPALFGLHLVYDGNPPGFGVGIAAPPTLHGFGEVASQATITARVGEVLNRRRDLPPTVQITQTVFAGGESRLQEESATWTVVSDRLP